MIKNEYEVRGDVTAIFLANGQIRETLLNTDDFEKVKPIPVRWFAHYCKSGDTHYAHCSMGTAYKNKRFLILHRIIMDAPKDFVVDHINHDTLDNRRSNLRVVTTGQNLQNITRQSKVHGGVKGVNWYKQTNRWHARIKVGGKSIHLGFYLDYEEAEKAVTQARAIHYPYSLEAMQLLTQKESVKA